MTVAVIVIILIVLAAPVAQSVQARLERTRCAKNLQNLHVAANLYIQEHQTWPQIDPSRAPETVASDWIEALQPYGITLQGWICPTVQKLLRSPDLTLPENRRTDYSGFPFSPEAAAAVSIRDGAVVLREKRRPRPRSVAHLSRRPHPDAERAGAEKVGALAGGAAPARRGHPPGRW